MVISILRLRWQRSLQRHPRCLKTKIKTATVSWEISLFGQSTALVAYWQQNSQHPRETTQKANPNTNKMIPRCKNTHTVCDTDGTQLQYTIQTGTVLTSLPCYPQPKSITAERRWRYTVSEASAEISHLKLFSRHITADIYSSQLMPFLRRYLLIRHHPEGF